jgi:hypothetical protein
VNGRALVSGINLAEMDASDMVDVVHYFFEEDTLRYESGEQAEAASKFRTKLYELYDRTYKYGVTSSGTANGDGGRKYIGKNEDFEFDNSIPNSKSNSVKPYIPPTQMDIDSHDPFGGVLDSPLR